MRRPAALLLLAPAILVGQGTLPDQGRLEPAWFGAAAAFQPSKALGFQWLKPGLDLSRRTLRLKAWEPAAWLLGPRAPKDQALLTRVERSLDANLTAGLRRGLKDAVALSPTHGDVVVLGRVVDAIGDSDDYMSAGQVALSFDLKLVDGDTGELLGAFHDTLTGKQGDGLPLQFREWSVDLGRLLATTTAVIPKPEATKPPAAAAVPAIPPVPPRPAFDLEGALRRIEGLKRDGLLSEEEYQALRKKAADKAK